MDQLGPLGAAIIERLGIAGDQQHLDIAAGHPPRSLHPDQHRSMINLSKTALGYSPRFVTYVMSTVAAVSVRRMLGFETPPSLA